MAVIELDENHPWFSTVQETLPVQASLSSCDNARLEVRLVFAKLYIWGNEGTYYQSGITEVTERRVGDVFPDRRQPGMAAVEPYTDVLVGVSGKTSPAWRSRHQARRLPVRLVSILPEHQRSVGATKAEAVTHHQRNLGILNLADNGITLRPFIQVLDVRGWRDKAILLHQQTVDSLMHTGGTQ